MLRIESGSTRAYCDGVSRRNFVQLGVMGMASVGLSRVLKAVQAPDTDKSAKDTSVILIWLDGGPSHMDLYDMKPQAPAEYRGIWKPVKTNVPGIEISELFERQAKIADKFSIVRSLHHDDGDHYGGAHRMLTGRPGATGANTTQTYPGISAISAKVLGSRKPGIPPHIAVPVSSTVGIRPGYFSGNYLGHAYDPFETHGDPNGAKFNVENLSLAPGMTIERLEDRRSLCQHFDTLRREIDNSGAMASMDQFERSAYELVTSPQAQKAFDIGSEDAPTRDLYGRTGWGQSCLLARRLAEAGATFVTVHMGGWDHHWDLQAGMEHHLPQLDMAVSGLFTDLARRGSLARTLVVMCGEFSRTPRMNDGGNGGPPRSKGTPGRDHWGNAMFCILGGGGLRGGTIVGATDRLGERPLDRPLTPSHIHQTIYHVLGVDPKQQFLNLAGRPVPLVDEGEPIAELV